MKFNFLSKILILQCIVSIGIVAKEPGNSQKIPKRDYWPTTDWQTISPSKVGLVENSLKKLDEYAFTITGDDKNRKGIRTDGIVIIKNGRLAYEKYARGYTKDKLHLAWSVTKSFVNALYGFARKDGLIKIEDYAYKYYPSLDKDKYKEIKIDDILRMSSGLDWSEGYEASPLKSSVIAMLYTSGHEDMAAFTASREMVHKPGTHLYYSSGDSNLLMGILKNILKNEYSNYPWKRLFDKIGMKNVVWEKDKSGTFVGSSYIYATPRDLAKFGYLYLNNGVWGKEKLFDDDWVKYTSTVAPAYYTTPNYKDQLTAQWYANISDTKNKIQKVLPDAPEDTIMASGHWGQKIFVIPSWDMVVVRVADDRDGSFDENHFMKLIKESIR
ncbi:MAG: beta-lactamase family protein [Leptospiraceae bacterium]|nr:serine hydrolase [Leptospiraceae bacterium]MCK6381996.1 beta-lactamase family protein [Leptospiraceae bacterium]NUM42597.1 serine hydrolase [Leptospiraceae bacterium]